MTSSESIEPPLDNNELPTGEVEALASLVGATDFLRQSPLYVMVQAYRSDPLSESEVQDIQDHIDSWRGLMSRHGVSYEGVIVSGPDPTHVDLIYHASLRVNVDKHMIGLPLVLDAVYELSCLIASAEFEIHSI